MSPRACSSDMPSGLPHLGGNLGGVAVARPVVQVRRDCYVAVMGKAAGRFPVPLVPTGHVVNQHHAGVRPRAQRLGDVGPDRVAVVALDRGCFRQHSLVHVCRIHGLYSNSDELGHQNRPGVRSIYDDGCYLSSPESSSADGFTHAIGWRPLDTSAISLPTRRRAPSSYLDEAEATWAVNVTFSNPKMGFCGVRRLLLQHVQRRVGDPPLFQGL